MAKQEAATKTAQAEAHLAALADEKAGYEARLAAVKDGHPDRLSEQQLGQRLKDVAAEEKRVSALLGKKKDAS